MRNDAWTVIGANGTSVGAGVPVSLNTVIGFKHQATEKNLHSHDTSHGKVTPISRQQQGIFEFIYCMHIFILIITN